MNSVYLYIVGASFLTSLISLVGVLFLSFSTDRLKRMLMFLVSLSAGSLLGGSFLHLLPESIEHSIAHGHNHFDGIWYGVLFGIIIFFILEKIIHWRHCHIPTSSDHIHPVGPMNLAGDALHNLIDGMIIAGAFLLDVRLGVVTTIAVIAHEIPQEIGDFGVLIHAGYSVKKALFFNFLSGLFSLIGAILIIFIGTFSDNFIDFIIPITAGGFIYIATADLIPELKKECGISKSLKQLLGVFLGISFMIIIKFFFHIH
ncbi:MAG: ZIP family metal transporter [Patescibacteria group bacterium]